MNGRPPSGWTKLGVLLVAILGSSVLGSAGVATPIAASHAVVAPIAGSVRGPPGAVSSQLEALPPSPAGMLGDVHATANEPIPSYAVRTRAGVWVPTPPVRSSLALLSEVEAASAATASPSASSEPAPIGISDLGFTASSTPYSYSTNRFLGSAEISSLSTYGPQFDLYSITMQLNVVLYLTDGSQSASYWIQDVPYLNTSTQQITFIDNVWNLSSPGLSFPSNSIQGNGSVEQLGGGEGFYGEESDPNLPGNYIELAYPANFSAEVVASTLAGYTHVGFEYNDGYGWVTYDNVTFPWTKGWTSHGFLVDGANTPPAGAYYDAEWVLCGPGDGSSTIDEASNLSLQIERYNGHNFEAVPNAFNFGADTAESVSNVVDSLSGAPSAGFPTAVVTNGSGSLGFLYGPADVAILNASGVPAGGDLAIDGVPVDYSGSSFNVSLLPGPYRLDLQSTSGSTPVNFTVGSGEYFGTSGLWAPVALAPTGALPSSLVTASGTSFGAGQTFDVDWYPGGGPVCAIQIPGSGALSCSFDVPLIRSGWYGILATNRTSGSTTGFGSFFVRTNLTATVSSSAAVNDAQVPFDFTAHRSGGYAPYSEYQWTFGDGSQTTSSGDNVSHSFSSAGTYIVRAEVTDSLGSVAVASTGVTVAPDPSVFAPVANRSSADVGQSVSFSAYYTSGAGDDVFIWSGLPPGCSGSTPSVSCDDLPAPANYSVSVTITDADGFQARSGSVYFRVHHPPVLGAPIANRTSLDVGQQVAYTVNVSDPGSGIARTIWSLKEPEPLGFSCNATSSNDYVCSATSAGTFSIQSMAVDTNGVAANATSTPIVVLSDPSVSPPGFRPPIGDVGVPMNGSVWATGGSGEYRYVWAGLPGCAGVNASIRCAPTLVGTFNVTTTVVDSNGYLVTSEVTVVGVNPPMAVSVNHPNGTQTAGAPLAFAMSVTGGTSPYKSTWKFGDGEVTTGASVTHSYASTGAYGVQVWVNDSAGGTVFREFAVIVSPPPSPFSLSSIEGDVPYLGTLVVLVAGVAIALAWRPRAPPPKVPVKRAPPPRNPIPPKREAKPPSWDDPSGWD